TKLSMFNLMAGMSAMFLGVQIQPITFFQGYTDLMSKYFTAPDGPMNILSGNILLINQKQSVILQSGLQTQVFFHGGLSVDVSADLDFSLFTQESKSTVNNGSIKNMIFNTEMFFAFMPHSIDAVIHAIGALTR
uniref:Microsomal triglyceride transfer protein n=1 Tax=Astyanax mexicanus TaxID=7994 RepID=A0A3B1IUX3_ASTMX